MALLPGSPAIHAGKSTPITTDQRGFPLDSSTPDIGAFQSQGFTLTVVAGSTPQAGRTGAAFANPLAVTVTADDIVDPVKGGVPVEPVAGGIVSFALNPAGNGASASISGATAIIGSSGVAQVSATANTFGGSYTVTASAIGAVSPVNFALSQLAPLTFSGIANQSIPLGTATATFSGTLANGAQTPQGESIAVTLDGVTLQAAVGASGAFSATFNTASLAASRTPYPISYLYKSDGAFDGASATSSLTVTQAEPTVSVVDGGGTYNGTSFPAVAGVSGINGSESSSLEGVTPTLAYYSGTGSLDSATLLAAAPSQAGEYTVVASFAGSADYASGTALVHFTIAQATPGVTVADAGGTFSGATFAATVAVAAVGGSKSSSLEGVTPTLAYYSGTGSLDSATLLAAAPSQAGAYTVVAIFAGSADYASGTALAKFTITQASPSLSVADAGGMYSGAAFAATVGVAGVSGTVSSSLEGVTPTLAYYSGTGALDSATLLAAAPSQAGAYTAEASFAGSADYASGTALAKFTITQAPPSVTVADAGGTYSGAAFAATVAVAGLSGSQSPGLEGVTPTLAYYSGTGSHDSATLLSAAPSQAGAYTVVASFAGSADYASGTALANFTITQATPLVTWVAPASIIFGTPLGSSQLDASANVAGSPVYSPDAGAFLNAGSGQTLSVTFTPSDSVDYTTVTKTTTINVAKATPTFTVADAGGQFDGRSFPASVTIAGTGTENSPTASLEGITPTLSYNTSAGTSLGSTPPTAAGNYTVLALFPGNTNYSPVQSPPVPFTIAQGNATIVLTSSIGSAVYGQSVTFVATVAVPASGAPSGSVTFSDGGTALATVPLASSGVATFLTSALAIGAHSITATFSVDATSLGVQSAAIAEPVTHAGTQVILVPQPVFNKKKKLVSVGLKAEVEPLFPGAGVPTGEVTFEMLKTVKRKTKTTTLGTVALSGGDAMLTLNAKKVLKMTIKIVYSGDNDFESSIVTPAMLTQSGLKGLARPMVALVNRGRLQPHVARTIAS